MRSMVIAGAAALLSACASTGGASFGLGGPPTAPAASPEAFSYTPATSRDARASVESVTLTGQNGFLPTDPNWLQVRLRIENTGGRTLTLQNVRARLADGTTVPAASSIAELLKPPSLMRSQLGTLGLGAGGMALGLLFPPAAIASGAAIVLGPAISQDRMQKRATVFAQQALRANEPVAPGTTAVGDVWLPAVRGQTGIIIFYEAGGQTHSLVLMREGQQ